MLSRTKLLEFKKRTDMQRLCSTFLENNSIKITLVLSYKGSYESKDNMIRSTAKRAIDNSFQITSLDIVLNQQHTI